jgi:hypothetical protein
MAYTINTKYAMKAKVATLMDNGKVINHRGHVGVDP